MTASEVQLWRLVNATEGNSQGVIDSSLWSAAVIGDGPDAGKDPKKFNVMQTAMDGVQLSPDNYKNQPFLNPNAPSGLVPGGLTLESGNRADLLVQAPKTPGLYVFQYKYGGKKQKTAILFFVEVKNPAAPQQTPSVPAQPFPTTWVELPKFLNDLTAPGPKSYPNVVQFQWEYLRDKPVPNSDGAPPHFMINNRQFAQMGEVVDQCMPEGGLQDWVLENYTPEIAHPFHIHINPFQVIEIDTPTQPDPNKPPVYTTYTPKDNFVWQDVIAIPPAVISKDGRQITPGRVRIRHTFVDFPGTFVLHCHILAHEDRGMMQLVRVVPANQYPNACQQAIPEHH
jgi:FtsP/CotA-like multicopper oxidase with cupredoxin domain